jgi:hypothetical protein
MKAIAAPGKPVSVSSPYGPVFRCRSSSSSFRVSAATDLSATKSQISHVDDISSQLGAISMLLEC